MLEAHDRGPLARRGFTLIELLVTIAIASALLGLGVVVVRAFRTDGADLGAEQVQGWFRIAKTRALRDKAPRGLRLIRDAAGSPFARKVQYIEVPNDFTGGMVSTAGNNQAQVMFTFQAGQDDLTGGLGGNQALWPVQPQDFLQVNGGPLYRIMAVDPSGTSIQVSPTITITTPTSDYKIIRGPRPVAGEDLLTLPEDVVIDLTMVNDPSRTDPRAPFSTYVPSSHPLHVDVLFAPGGEVTTQDPLGKVVLWIRKTDSPLEDANQSLVTIYTQTGLIAAHPIYFEQISGMYDLHFNTRKNWASGL